MAGSVEFADRAVPGINQQRGEQDPSVLLLDRVSLGNLLLSGDWMTCVFRLCRFFLLFHRRTFPSLRVTVVQAESSDDDNHDDDDDDVCICVYVHVLVNLGRVFFRHCVFFHHLGRRNKFVYW